MVFAICNLIATISMFFILKDISNLSKSQTKAIYSRKNSISDDFKTDHLLTRDSINTDLD